MHDGAVISVAQQVLLQNHSRFQPHATYGNSYVIYYSSAVPLTQHVSIELHLYMQ
jgi:hypothetical protein